MASERSTHRRHLRLEPLERRCLLATSSLLWTGVDDHLIYQPDAAGDRVPDFSDVGYKAGREDIPDVSAVVTVSPVAGDDTAVIQTAINQVAAMPLDSSGFRGAVLLQAGHYDIGTQLTISTSGIVLRGEGRGTDGTVLHARGDDQRALISVNGPGSMQMLGSAVSMTDYVVPVGARTFHVSDTSGLGVGDSILITRPSTAEWIHDISMDLLNEPWQPGSKDLNFERVITRIEGNSITIDVPLTNSFEQQYGGGTVQAFSFSDRIENVGVENLRGESDFDSDTDEDHSWDFVSIYETQDAWVRQTTAQYFAYAHVKIGSTSKRVTVSDAINLDPKSIITGGRRYAFTILGQQNLITGCESYEGRHDYVLHSLVEGPNVFHDSDAINAYSDTGPHHRWSTGALFDNIVSDGELNAENRWNSGTGHGWAGANMVFYNCTADGFNIQNPPTAQNWVIGSIGEQRDGSYITPIDEEPGIYDSHGTPVLPDSLYDAQHTERTAYANLEYREYWLGDIDGFTGNDDSSIDDVYVDAAWAAAIPGTAIGFDDLVNDRWVPFSFQAGLVPSELLVGATVSLGMQNTGGSSADDRIYLESTSDSLLFGDLGWTVSNTEEDGYVLDLGGRLDLLADGLLNLAVAGDTAIDWAVLNLQVIPAEAVTYVDDDFSGSPGDPIADADLGTAGNQSAVLGVTAFTTVAEAAVATASGGTIIVNSGTYAENASLLGTQTLHVTGPDVAQAVTLDSLAGATGTTLLLEGSIQFTAAGSSTVGRLHVRSNRAEPVVITLPAGHDLTVAGDVSVGVPSTTGAVTNVTVTGGGDLNISNPSATVDFGLANSDQNSTENSTVVDLSGLGSFSADVDTFRVGYGSRIRSTLLLSDTANSITAGVLSVSNSVNKNARPALMTLGSGTNTIHADAIEVGLGKGNGTIAFATQTPGSPGTVTIRGRSGGSVPVDITVGYDDITATGTTPVGLLDLRGHGADVVAGTLTLAHRTIGGSGGVTGTLSFDDGTFVVDVVDMATKSGGDNSNRATLNIGGGTFTVNAGGSFQLAQQTGGGAANSTLNITGGSVTSNVDITDGGGTSTTTITLDGGTLDLTGHSMGGATPVNVLNFHSGALRNVGQINNGAVGLAKTTSGTLIVRGVNTYTGATSVGDGVLQVDGSITSSVTVNSGATLHGSGVITGNVSGTGTFSPGSSPGQMTIHGDFTPAGTVGFEVNSPFVAGTDYDQYVVSGGVNLSAATLTFATTTPAILALPSQLTLIANGSIASTVAASSPAEGAEVVVGSATGNLFYNGGDGNDVVLAGTVVNEPPTIALQNTVTTLSEDDATTPRVKVADILITDDAQGTNDLSLAGDDVALFELDGHGLYLKDGTVLDHTANPVLDVTVRVDDATVGGTPDDTASLAITVTPSAIVRVLGGVGDDVIEISAGVVGGAWHTLTVNGSPENFDPAVVDTFEIDGGGGNDLLKLLGTAGDEEATLLPGSVDLFGPGYAVHGVNVGTIHIDAGADGIDEVSLAGSSGSNRLYSYAEHSVLSDSPRTFYQRVAGFDEVSVEAAAGGRDYAFLYDSPAGDLLTASPDDVELARQDGSSSRSAAGFQRVYAYATAGGDDTATLTGSETTRNRFYGYTDYSILTESRRTFYFYARGFQTVNAESPGSATSYAFLFDSAGVDTLTATPASTSMDRAEPWSDATAQGFQRVYAYSTRGGMDSATLTGSSDGGNRFRGYPTYGTLTDRARSFYHYARGFRWLTAEGSQTDLSTDRAHLYDSSGDDVFYDDGEYGHLEDKPATTYQNRFRYFDYVYARSTDQGTDDTIAIDPEQELAYILIRSGTW